MQFHFLRPYWLLLIVPFAVLSVIQWRRSDLGKQWEPVIAPHLLPSMIVPGSQRRLFSPLWVSIILGPLLAVTVAGPSWQRGDSPFAQDAAALIIAVDLSASMKEPDLQPSRLQRARDKILKLAQSRGDAYTALIAYSGSAHTVLPLSNDSNMLLHYLDALDVGMLPRRGKAPEKVLPIADKLLANRGNGGSLLIVGDGAGEESAALFGEWADATDTQLLVWGMGKTQSQLDEDAARGLAARAQPLQEAQLRAISSAGGGHYEQVSVDDRDLRSLERRINRHYQLSEDSARPWIDGGIYLLPPIMLLFLLWFRQGWVLRW
ncbi:VWA domain-containing protein [Congregibacter brevis]|uniref:VWA domain-containing protein n=1 Tax=Congregibacter brevis TaxID=3081201 RepID=A0ABZ0IB42_9GAMM|nr:VWA domain-containing protein [Congregibacter sp. IMCC45268]